MTRISLKRPTPPSGSATPPSTSGGNSAGGPPPESELPAEALAMFVPAPPAPAESPAPSPAPPPPPPPAPAAALPPPPRPPAENFSAPGAGAPPPAMPAPMYQVPLIVPPGPASGASGHPYVAYGAQPTAAHFPPPGLPPGYTHPAIPIPPGYPTAVPSAMPYPGHTQPPMGYPLPGGHTQPPMVPGGFIPPDYPVPPGYAASPPPGYAPAPGGPAGSNPPMPGQSFPPMPGNSQHPMAAYVNVPLPPGAGNGHSLPPLHTGMTGGPFPPAILVADRPYQAPPRRKVVFWGPSTLIFIGCCAFAYYKYDEYLNRPPPAPASTSKAPLKEVSLKANPLTALKDAKQTLDQANTKLKSAYDTVAAMDSTTAAGAPPPAQGDATATTVPSGPQVVVTGSQVTATNQVVSPVESAATPVRQNTPAAATAPAPNAAFTRWAQRVRIGGLRMGEDLRVFIGSTAYKRGDLVEPQLGISFVDYDADRRQLRFTDKTGAIIDIRH